MKSLQTVILAGGYGSRLAEETEHKPKPMVEIGGLPILWHIMKTYSLYGFNEFLLALGYKEYIIKNYFLNYYYRNDFSINLKNQKISIHENKIEDWLIHLIDTGLKTGTGGRLKNLGSFLNDGTFLMTYGDGLANVDIKKLVSFHKKHGKLATVTAVHPPSRFGGLELKKDMVSRFVEKPQIEAGWINGGFFVLEKEVLDYIDNDATMFEQEPLERLAKDNQLVAYQHNDFWQCMDTVRDVKFLNELWENNQAPWKEPAK